MSADLRDQLQDSLGGGYTIERELGGGGMSRTYVARDQALKRRVVVKVLSPDLTAGVSIDRFKREIELAAGLQHPHIVPVLSAGDTNGLPYYTMPFVAGESLRGRLARGPLPIGEAIGVLRDVARALAFAHANGVLHRDIKPDNVLLAGGSAAVADFGIAKALTAARTHAPGATITKLGTAIGTPAYMAPEQAAGDPRVDERADLYALGCMAYETLAGHPPFHALSPQRLLAAHMAERPRHIAELRPDVPAPLADLVMRCLEKEAGARPQSAADVVRLLETVTSGGAGAPAPAILRGGHVRIGRAVALWAVGTALVAITAWAATDVIGLPDWVLSGSLGVMLAGLPVIAFTWYVQRAAHRVYTATPAFTPGGTPAPHGTLATIAIKASPHVSWRRTWLGGAIAVGSFVALVVGFMVMRALGIGPVGSLMGAGKLEAGETLVVADFRGPASDSSLGVTVAEALRTDLRQSSSLDVMTRASVREVLRLMQRPVEGVVDFSLAREIATREGAKAVLDGEVVRLGRSYVVSARLVSALDGAELATFRETADGEDDLIGALGQLSRDIRGKVGESLKTIRDTKPLERVTTPSLAALRKYVEGNRLADEVGDTERGLALLEEAVALDSAFAMAWRKIAVVVGNMGNDRPRQIAAATHAFRHRERLTEMERLLTEAYYYSNGPEPDREKALAAYESLIEADPGNATALNNAAVVLGQMREHARAERYLRRVLVDHKPFGSAFTNLMMSQIRLGKLAAADSTRLLYRARIPDHENVWEADWYVRWMRGDVAAADLIAREVFRSARRPTHAQRAASVLAATAYLRGQVREGLRWDGERHDAIFRATRSPVQPLLASLDSAVATSFFLERHGEARQIVRRALARTPPSTLPPAARPWNLIALAAAAMQDSALARDALAGFEADIAELGLANPDGDRARMRAWVAAAAGRHDDVIADVRRADDAFAIFERRAMTALAEAHDLAGRPDSAIVHYERFLATPDPQPLMDGFFRAGTHKRLGELYEARGDTARAEAHYRRFIELWRDADPELQHAVRDARERLTRLGRQRG